MTSRRIFIFFIVVGVLSTATRAQAHLMNTGFGPFYDGLAHLFVSPEDFLPVIALALLAGLRGSRPSRAVLFILPLAWLLGAFVAQMPIGPSILVAVVLTILLGALVAADLTLPDWIVAVCAIVLGLVQGNLSGIQLRISGMAGVVFALFMVVALVTGQVTSLRSAWSRIVVRVAGSWIAAMGLLMFGWLMRASR
jgi:hydrogenase/urease accessory protein HupE